MIPSPQCVMHTEAVVADPPEQKYPVIGPEQSDLHPADPTGDPVSQTSFPTQNPSPHIGVQG